MPVNALTQAERNLKILEMRAAGASFKVIAGTFGIRLELVWQVLRRAKDKLATEVL